MSLIKPLYPKSDTKDKFIDLELNIKISEYKNLGIPWDELVQHKFGKIGFKGFDFGDFDDVQPLSRKRLLDSLKFMRQLLETSKREDISKSIREINQRYIFKEENLDKSIKKMECEMYLESIKINRNNT